MTTVSESGSVPPDETVDADAFNAFEAAGWSGRRWPPLPGTDCSTSAADQVSASPKLGVT